ncbi:MAG: D-cysteine desulfhydrase [Mesorhizobium sp.]|nr:MAG: D-cysteine desulfhydrase [Mesorhizobium sp.]
MQFPRLHIVHLPTPLEPLDRLSAALKGPRIWIKRDDCTGLATGGNKARKLEFLMADAIQRGADTIITSGATQSNHARQTAAFAAKLGLKCKLVLEECVKPSDISFRTNGNALLDRLVGAETLFVTAGTETSPLMSEIAQDCSANGGTPYVIPVGGSNPIGTMGYVQAARELNAQTAELKLNIDEIVLASGSAGTQAGLLVGFRACDLSPPVWGVSVGRSKDALGPLVLNLAQQTAEFAGVDMSIALGDVLVSSEFVGQGYGLPTSQAIEAIELTARHEGILLDPVYTGKAMAGLIHRIRQGIYRPGQNIVFWHTGGVAGLFAYADEFPRPRQAGSVRASRALN